MLTRVAVFDVICWIFYRVAVPYRLMSLAVINIIIILIKPYCSWYHLLLFLQGCWLLWVCHWLLIILIKPYCYWCHLPLFLQGCWLLWVCHWLLIILIKPYCYWCHLLLFLQGCRPLCHWLLMLLKIVIKHFYLTVSVTGIICCYFYKVAVPDVIAWNLSYLLVLLTYC